MMAEMNKINAVATSATGKIIFFRALVYKLGLYYIELNNLFWLDLPFSVNLYCSVKHVFHRAWHQQELWSNSSNQESLPQLFG